MSLKLNNFFALHADMAGKFILGILLLILCSYNQPYYPVTWIDEGFALQGAVNLAQYGQYAMRSVEGFRLFDQPLIANGPGVVLPIALVFKIFGVNLLHARIVIVLFSVTAGLLIFGMAQGRYGFLPALITLLILLSLPEEGFLLYGRHALGMLPSLVYFLVGYLFWKRALSLNRDRDSILAGIFFGIAAVTKGQYYLLLPVLIIAFVIDRFSFKKIPFKSIAWVVSMMLVCIFAWFGIQLVILGMPKFLQNIEALRASSQVTVSAFRTERIPGNIFYLIRSGILLVVLPGWLYALWQNRSKSIESAGTLIPIVFIPVWLAWFAFVSVGFHRYAYDPFVLGAILFGKFVGDVLADTWQRYRMNWRGGWPLRAGALILIVATMGFAVINLIGQVRRITAIPVKSPQRLAEFIQSTIDPQAVIESWEWEIDTLTPQHNYHHPTNNWVDEMTRKLQFGELVEVDYAFQDFNPQYLIDGPFSKWTGLYTGYLESGCCEKLYSGGQYDLYRVFHQ